MSQRVANIDDHIDCLHVDQLASHRVQPLFLALSLSIILRMTDY